MRRGPVRLSHARWAFAPRDIGIVVVATDDTDFDLGLWFTETPYNSASDHFRPKSPYHRPELWSLKIF